MQSTCISFIDGILMSSDISFEGEKKRQNKMNIIFHFICITTSHCNKQQHRYCLQASSFMRKFHVVPTIYGNDNVTCKRKVISSGDGDRQAMAYKC